MSVMVSIICNTFNHEKYVADALESFVNQKTNFEYEILVYDDASTDSTQAIIRKYEEKYPHLIKPVYQTVNQYSQGLRPGHQNRQRASGKYVAMCEGDDYWIDPEKIQKQVDYMEQHPECTFCFSNGYVSYDNELKIDRPIVPWDANAILKEDSQDYNAGELELIGYIPTASFMYRRALPFLPVEEGSFMGDAYMKLSMTSHGYAHFFPECMCAYRRGVTESATALWEKKPDQYAAQCDSFIKLYDSIQAPTNHMYDDVFRMRVCQWKITKNYSLKNYSELKRIAASGDLKYLKKGNAYSRVNYWAKCIMPKTFDFVRITGRKLIRSIVR